MIEIDEKDHLPDHVRGLVEAVERLARATGQPLDIVMDSLSEQVERSTTVLELRRRFDVRSRYTHNW